MDRGSTTLELSRSLAIPHTREDTLIPMGDITMEAIPTMGGSSHNHSGPKNGSGSGGNNNQNRSNPATPAKKDLSHVTCFKCGKTGHYAMECPEGKNGNGNGSAGKKPNPFNKGHVNHVNVEEVEEELDAVIGKFLVKSFTALVLFDTGSSHSYISRGFVDKFKLPTLALGHPC